MGTDNLLERAMYDALIECRDNRYEPSQDEFLGMVEIHLTEEPSEDEKDTIAEFYQRHFEAV